MDFVTNLSENVKSIDIYNAIFVILDKLLKIYHYIPCCSKITERKLAKVIYQIRSYSIT